ncbi:MAG TPA: TetR/AcrR family transcriptional regulator [Mucilaginibacter sp.]|nr:TetR/AcrR family transcriptional regulator [Mucilaginibacter sp.]
MNDTREEIVNLADKLVRERGFNGFSYADISKALNIKNAAVHYYFPSKADLGLEVISRAVASFRQITPTRKHLTWREQLDLFIDNYRQKQKHQDICLIGAFSSVSGGLSEDMQRELKKLASDSLNELTTILTEGKEAGEFSFKETPEAKAYLIQSALIASLLLDRVLQNNVFDQIEQGLTGI